MRLDSVRSLKQELVETRPAPAALARALGVRASSREARRRFGAEHTRPPRSTTLALGVARGHGRGDFCLGARIHAPGPAGRRLAAALERHAHGECHVRVMRFVRKRAPTARWFRARRRPLEAGLSVGHYRTSAGTLGFVVRDEDAYYVLSNNHVLAEVNRGQPGEPVVQPGPIDRRPSLQTLIGVLDRYVPISFVRSNLVDAAVATIHENLEFFAGWSEALPGRVVGVEPLTSDDLGLPVSKAGRTTGVTHGEINQVEIDRLQVDMGDDPRRPEIAQFSDQFEVTMPGRRAFSDGGDSGSLIVDRRGRARGLLFAGGEDVDGTDYTYANRIETVLGKLGVALAR